MSFKRYPEIERLGSDENKDILLYPEDTLVIEEKVDGGNGSFWIDDDSGSIHFGSRNRDLTVENDDKAFIWARNYLADHLMSITDRSGIRINADYIYYCEWMETHTIRYTNAPQVIGIDIRLKRAKNQEGEGLFLGRDTRAAEFDRLGIENVPLVWRGTTADLKKLVIRDLIPKSKYYDGMAEGIVIKNYCRKAPEGNHQLYAKLVRDEFKEDNKAMFGSVKNKMSDTTKLVERFCTDARIRKAVLVYLNEDKMPLSLRLMALVPHYVMMDIFEEETAVILKEYKFLDIKDFRVGVTKKCLRVITEMMTEKAGGL